MLSRQRQTLLRKARSAVIVGIGGTVSFGIIGAWTGNEKFYKQFVNPFLARMDAETSHRAAVYAAKYHLIKNRSQTDPEILKTKIGSIEVPNPIGIAAGFDKNAECMSGLTRMGFGWVEIGSVTPLPQEGNPKPRVFRIPEDDAVINRYGFNNDGHEKVHDRVVQFKQEYPEFVVGVNLGANKTSTDRVGDYCEGIKMFSDCADYFVINVSSPNTPNLRELQKSENLQELLQRVIKTRNSQNRSVPLFLKVAPDIADNDIKTICKSIMQKDTKIDGIIVSNTTVSRNGLKTESSVKMEVGGLSGKPLGTISTELVGKFYNELEGAVPIIGVGGVWDGNDAFKKICAGASAVQIYTALAYNGPGLVDRIKSELADLLTTSEYKSVKDAVGATSKK